MEDKLKHLCQVWRLFPIKIRFISCFYIQPSFFKFNTPFIQHWHSFFNFNIVSFNLDSRFLSSTFVLFKHDDFVICFLKRMMLNEKRMTNGKQMSRLSKNI